MGHGNKLYDLAPGSGKPRMDPEAKAYLAKEDCRVLRQAEEVRSDPNRLKAAQSHAQSEMKAYATLFGKPEASKGSPRPKK